METKDDQWEEWKDYTIFDSDSDMHKITDDEILEDMDFKVVEAFVRKKKLERISKQE